MGAKFRTAPCVLQDALAYDPSSSRCPHIWAQLNNRTVLPRIDQREIQKTEYRTAAICWTCRSHITLIVACPNPVGLTCPTDDFPLHHLRPIQDASSVGHTFEARFVCTSPICKAEVNVQIRPPTLTLEDILFLTNQASIRARGDAVRVLNPDLPDRNAAQNLRTLRSYVSQAVNNDGDKLIRTTNPNFMFALGANAHRLLIRLGFTFPFQNERDESCWRLPKPAQDPDHRFNTQLQDVEDELTILMHGRPDAEKQVLSEEIHPPQPDTSTMAWTLSSLDYDRFAPPQQPYMEVYSEDETDFQALGAVSDFADKLVDFAYDRQVIWDPSNTAKYLRALHNIAITRQSGELQNKVAMLKSQGFVDSDELKELYGYFGIDEAHMNKLNEYHLSGRYHSFHDDSGPKERKRARETLLKIAITTGSLRLQAIAKNNVDSYDDALAYLNQQASRETEDEFILILAQTKVDESRDNLPAVREAVEIICKHRPNSQRLRLWLGSDDSQDHKLTEAYQCLGIEADDPSSVDDQAIQDKVTLQLDCSDTQQLVAALSLVATRRDSLLLRATVSDIARRIPSGPPQQTSLSNPRGIKNIGNTCYLNSLLQYFFTVKRVRDLVEDVDPFKQQISPQNPLIKKVGGDAVSELEVERAHSFVRELNVLFQRLISDHETYIVPNEELARLTLKPVTSAATRSRTSNEPPRRLSHTLSSPINVLRESEMPSDTVNSPNSTQDDKLSSQRRQSRSQPAKDSTDASYDDTVNKSGDSSTKDKTSPDRVIVGNEDASDSHEPTLSEEPMELDKGGSNRAATNATGAEAPTQPPPVPPRPNSNGNRAEYESYAQQQDVQEVIENVLYLLRWAIKADTVGSDGEQVDLVSRTFFGKMNTIVFDSESEKSQIAPFPYLIIWSENGFNMYDAMDKAFYVSELEVGNSIKSQFNTLREIPPILQFYVPRVRYNKETNEPFKDLSPLELFDDVVMDRYMDDADMISKRKQSWAMKKQLRELDEKRDRLVSKDLALRMSDALRATQQYVRDIGAADDDHTIMQGIDETFLSERTEEIAQEVQLELDRLDIQTSDLETDLDKLFDSERKLKYRLHAVFIHRGNAYGGHWFIYIRDAKDTKSGIWRKYNDEDVTTVDTTSTIYKPDRQSGETSAFVVYVRDEDPSQLVETVCRIPAPKAEPPEPVYDLAVTNVRWYRISEEHARIRFDNIEQLPNAVAKTNLAIGETGPSKLKIDLRPRRKKHGHRISRHTLEDPEEEREGATRGIASIFGPWDGKGHAKQDIQSSGREELSEKAPVQMIPEETSSLGRPCSAGAGGRVKLKSADEAKSPADETGKRRKSFDNEGASRTSPKEFFSEQKAELKESQKMLSKRLSSKRLSAMSTEVLADKDANDQESPKRRRVGPPSQVVEDSKDEDQENKKPE